MEVNSSPSLSTDTPLDKSIKEKVLGDAFRLINVAAENRINYKAKLKKTEVRKWAKRSGSPLRETEESDVEENEKRLAEWEKMNRGGYQLIYPVEVIIYTLQRV